MTTETDRVLLLMQPTAKAAFAALYPARGERDQMVTDALTQYKAAALAAASLLEMLCDSYRARAAQSPPVGSAAKAITVGPIKIEKFSAADDQSDAELADIFCGRAKVLRREHRRSTGGINFSMPLHIPREVNQ